MITEGNSLAVQCLELCAFTAEGIGSISGQGTKISQVGWSESVCVCVYVYVCLRASLVAQSVKNLPAMQETRVLSLGCEDPLEKEMVTHSSFLAWKIPWIEEPGGLQSMGSQESEMI